MSLAAWNLDADRPPIPGADAIAAEWAEASTFSTEKAPAAPTAPTAPVKIDLGPVAGLDPTNLPPGLFHAAAEGAGDSRRPFTPEVAGSIPVGGTTTDTGNAGLSHAGHAVPPQSDQPAPSLVPLVGAPLVPTPDGVDPQIPADPSASLRPALVVVPDLQGQTALQPPLVAPGDTVDDLLDDERPRNFPLWRCIVGPAGSGKTHLVKEEVHRWGDVLVCATTGIAAVNLGGVTVNSALWFYDTAQLKLNYHVAKLHAAVSRVARAGYRHIAIDECSMMPGEQLDTLVAGIEEVNERRDKDGHLPIGLTLIADFLQLPPVGFGDEHRKRHVKGSPIPANAPPIEFVFQRPAFHRFRDGLVKLSTMHRQTDPAFLTALAAVRCGDWQAALNYFGPRTMRQQDPRFDGTTIFALNREVDTFNAMRMNEISAPTELHCATRVGEQLAEWKHIPDELVLKPGCLVMILSNRRQKVEGQDPLHWPILYANGDLAYYMGHGHDAYGLSGALVKLQRNGEQLVVPTVTKQKLAKPYPWGEEPADEDILGSITYLPLRVAYASTVHKIQGLTLDSVQIDFHNAFWKTPGLLYVALTRARTPERLRLVGSPAQFAERCRINQVCKEWL